MMHYISKIPGTFFSTSRFSLYHENFTLYPSLRRSLLNANSALTSARIDSLSPTYCTSSSCNEITQRGTILLGIVMPIARTLIHTYRKSMHVPCILLRLLRLFPKLNG